MRPGRKRLKAGAVLAIKARAPSACSTSGQLQDFGIAARAHPIERKRRREICWRRFVTESWLGADRVCEVKCRADGFATLYAWLEGRDLLARKRDRDDFLIVLPFRIFRTLAIASEASCVRTPGRRR